MTCCLIIEVMRAYAALISVLLQANYCLGLTLPKIFTDGMVLQAAPTEAVIWGFLDGQTGIPVLLTLNCSDSLDIFEYIPEKVF